MPKKHFLESGENLRMYAIMKLEHEAPIYEYFGFGTLKGGILKCRLVWAIPEKKQTRGGGVENMHI